MRAEAVQETQRPLLDLLRLAIYFLSRGSDRLAMEIRSRKELWTLEGALPVIRRIAAIAKEHGFTVALYGSVLMKGESENDLDLYFIAAEEKTSAVHAQSCVHAIEKTLGESKCLQLTPNCTRIQLKDGKRIDTQFLDYTSL
jgi:hypothetical protein